MRVFSNNYGVMKISLHAKKASSSTFLHFNIECLIFPHKNVQCSLLRNITEHKWLFQIAKKKSDLFTIHNTLPEM